MARSRTIWTLYFPVIEYILLWPHNVFFHPIKPNLRVTYPAAICSNEYAAHLRRKNTLLLQASTMKKQDYQRYGHIF